MSSQNKGMFSITTLGNPFFLLASNESEMEAWIAAIKSRLQLLHPNGISTQTEASDIKEAGYLWKYRRSWQKRWFVLRSFQDADDKGGVILYYRSLSEPPAGMIAIRDIVSVTPSPTKSNGRSNCFDVTVENRAYKLSANTELERETWIKALNQMLIPADSKAERVRFAETNEPERSPGKTRERRQTMFPVYVPPIEDDEEGAAEAPQIVDSANEAADSGTNSSSDASITTTDNRESELGFANISENSQTDALVGAT